MATPDPLAELVRRNAALYDRFLDENLRIEQAFLARTPAAFTDALRAIAATARGELPVAKSQESQPEA